MPIIFCVLITITTLELARQLDKNTNNEVQ